MAQSISDYQTTTQTISMGVKAAAFFQSLATLTLLFLALPINAGIVLLSLLWSSLARPFQRSPVATHPKNILISGGKMTKALQLARSFHAAGQWVVLIETHKYWQSVHLFSNAVYMF